MPFGGKMPLFACGGLQGLMDFQKKTHTKKQQTGLPTNPFKKQPEPNLSPNFRKLLCLIA